MDASIAEYFARVIALATSTFDRVEYITDITPARSILRIQASYGSYRIFVTELFGDDIRKYRYYLLQGNRVEAGFDNSPDPRAIRLKYGRIGEHTGEYVPHLHLEDKNQLGLTEEMTFEDFVDWLRASTNLAD